MNPLTSKENDEGRPEGRPVEAVSPSPSPPSREQRITMSIRPETTDLSNFKAAMDLVSMSLDDLEDRLDNEPMDEDRLAVVSLSVDKLALICHAWSYGQLDGSTARSAVAILMAVIDWAHTNGAV